MPPLGGGLAGATGVRKPLLGGTALSSTLARSAGVLTLRVAWNTQRAWIAVTLVRRPAWHSRAGRVSGGPPPTWPAFGWRVRLPASGPASQAGRAAPILYWSGPLSVRVVASLARAVVLVGRCGFGGLRMHSVRGLFRVAGRFRRKPRAPWTWSQRTRPGTRPRRWTRPMEVTSAPNPVSTIGSAYPKCGS
jgi:hypothetical protein